MPNPKTNLQNHLPYSLTLGLIRQRRDLGPQPCKHRAIANERSVFGDQREEQSGYIVRHKMLPGLRKKNCFPKAIALVALMDA